jgi:hypothetical protein
MKPTSKTRMVLSVFLPILAMLLICDGVARLAGVHRAGAQGVDGGAALTGLSGAVVNVRDFGAAGNGVRDDRKAIQEALNSAKSGQVVFPPGVYRLSGFVQVEGAKGLAIVGAGAVLKPLDSCPVKSAEGDVLRLIRCTGVSVIGLSIDANKAARGGRETCMSLQLRGCADFRIVGCTFTDAICDDLYLASSDRATLAGACHDGLVKGCTFDGAFRNAISVIEAHHVKFVNNVIRNVKGTAPEAGIDIESNAENQEGANHHLEVVGNTISNCKQRGVWMVGTRSPYANTISANTITGCPYGIGQVDATQSDVTIADNRIEDCAAIGIGMTGTGGICQGNRLSRGKSHAIYAEGQNHVIRGNVIQDFGKVVEGECIHTAFGKGRNVIEGNVIRRSEPAADWKAIATNPKDAAGENYRWGAGGRDGRFYVGE